MLIFDEEFSELCAAAAVGRTSVIAWQDSPSAGHPTLDELIARGSTASLSTAARPRPRRDPHLGHDRHAAGRLAPPAALA